MQVRTEIKKWGNSLALRVSGLMATVPNFSAGDPVTVDVSERGLVVKPVNRRRETLIYTESELLAGLTPETAHADELARLTDLEFGD